MNKLLSLLLTTTILFANEGGNYFVDNFLKYSTFYASVSLNAPFEVQSKWEVDVDNGTFVETTKENELEYNLSHLVLENLQDLNIKPKVRNSMMVLKKNYQM